MSVIAALPLFLSAGFVPIAHADGGAALPAPVATGLVQAWVTAWDQDESAVADPAGYGDPEDDSGMKLRRVRIGFEGSDERLRYGVLFGSSAPFDALSGGSHMGIVDAYGGLVLMEGLSLTAGLQKVPVSRELLTSAADLALGERAVASEWIAPGRDVGVLATGHFGASGGLRARIHAGAFNGNGDWQGDDNAGKLLAARAEMDWGQGSTMEVLRPAEGLVVGIAADGWLDEGLATSTQGYGGDAVLRYQGTSLLGELRWAELTPTASDVDVPGVWVDTTRAGWAAQITHLVGDFHGTARIDGFDDDTDAEDNGDLMQVCGGIGWAAPDARFRAGAVYVHREETSGAPTANDSARVWMQLDI
jgi:hypothetical protein